MFQASLENCRHREESSCSGKEMREREKERWNPPSWGWWTHYLIKEGVVPSPDSSPVGLVTHVHLNHWFDVVARQLAALYDANTNLNMTRVHSYQLITTTTQTWTLTVNLLQIRSFKPRAKNADVWDFFFFLYLMAWWILLWFMRKERLDYSGKRNLEQGQYLEVLRFVGQGFVPPTAELAWLSVGFPRLLCWSGSGHTSALAPSVHKGLPVIAVIVASWEGREIIFRHPCLLFHQTLYFDGLPASTHDMSPSGWSFPAAVAFGGGSYPISKFMVAWKITSAAFNHWLTTVCVSVGIKS